MIDQVSYGNQAAIFLISLGFGTYILLVMLRFLFQCVRADFYNELVQLLVRLTNPPLIPLRRYIPGWLGLDMAAVVLMMVLKVVELFLTYLMFDRMPNIFGLLVESVGDLLGLGLSVLFWAIVIRAVVSWLSPGSGHPVMRLIYPLTEPAMARVRRHLPPVSGIDLSPIAVIIAIQLLQILLVSPLRDAGRYMAIGG